MTKKLILSGEQNDGEVRDGVVMATRCALCGGDNECAVAAGKTSCWCMEVSISADLLSAARVESGPRRCICRECVAASGARKGSASQA